MSLPTRRESGPIFVEARLYVCCSRQLTESAKTTKAYWAESGAARLCHTQGPTHHVPTGFRRTACVLRNSNRLAFWTDSSRGNLTSSSTFFLRNRREGTILVGLLTISIHPKPRPTAAIRRRT